MSENNSKSDNNVDAKNPLEWVVFAISLLLITAIFGYLGYKTYTHKSSPPDLKITFQADTSAHSPNRYRLEVENVGGETAEEVNVELILEKNGQLMEAAALQLPFVPTRSTREGWVSFSKDPSVADTVYSRVVSYKKP